MQTVEQSSTLCLWSHTAGTRRTVLPVRKFAYFVKKKKRALCHDLADVQKPYPGDNYTIAACTFNKLTKLPPQKKTVST